MLLWQRQGLNISAAKEPLIIDGNLGRLLKLMAGPENTGLYISFSISFGVTAQIALSLKSFVFLVTI